MPFDLTALLGFAKDEGASDLHISAGMPPMVRIRGEMVRLEMPALERDAAQAALYDILNDEQKKVFEQHMDLDFAFEIPGVSRFRANVFVQKRGIGGVFRVVPSQVKSLDELAMPKVLKDLCGREKGLIVVTGPTGSGKSTTLAAMVDYINETERCHILTIEDPIEFVHQHKLSVVNQREIGTDTDSFTIALKHALRQDPDVVLVGEMRDRETIEAALTIAETGHLAFATLHTNSAVTSINRIIDVFPPHQQQQIRVQISMTLIAVMSQQLLPRAQGSGRVMALEVMVPNAAIRNLVREDKLHQVYSQMQVGQSGSGMQTMNQALAALYLRQAITIEEAFSASSDQDELRLLITPPAQRRA